jgi:hypothetical protein
VFRNTTEQLVLLTRFCRKIARAHARAWRSRSSKRPIRSRRSKTHASPEIHLSDFTTANAIVDSAEMLIDDGDERPRAVGRLEYDSKPVADRGGRRTAAPDVQQEQLVAPP